MYAPSQEPSSVSIYPKSAVSYVLVTTMHYCIKLFSQVAAGPSDHSALYNGMIYPMKGFSVRAVIWYQGEANVPQGRDAYLCNLAALIQVSKYEHTLELICIPCIGWKYQNSQLSQETASKTNGVFFTVGMEIFQDYISNFVRFHQQTK